MELYGARINDHDFDALADLIATDASFWFSEGSFTGPAIRAAFERTWARIADERYWLEDLLWIAGDARAAACTYTFHWRGTVEGHPTQGHAAAPRSSAATPPAG